MEFRNDQGHAIDPVPFLVVVAMGFLVCYSYFPITLIEIGLSLAGALTIATFGYLAGSALAYYWMVWTARPELRGEIPLAHRIHRMLYGALGVVAVMALFALVAVAR